MLTQSWILKYKRFQKLLAISVVLSLLCRSHPNVSKNQGKSLHVFLSGYIQKEKQKRSPLPDGMGFDSVCRNTVLVFPVFYIVSVRLIQRHYSESQSSVRSASSSLCCIPMASRYAPQPCSSSSCSSGCSISGVLSNNARICGIAIICGGNRLLTPFAL